MADLGRLRWVLTADTRQLDNALRRTARGFQRLGAIAAAGFSLRGAGNFMRGAVDAADNMQKTADAAGILVEHLQQLRFVADLAGVEQRQFDDAIQRFALRLGKAQLGFGPLLETLKRYNEGTALAIINSRGTIMALGRLANLMAQVGPQQQAALAAGAFGVSNVRMVGMMRGGARGIAAGAADARANLSILTTETTRTMEELSDNWSRMSQNISSSVLNMSTGVLKHVADMVAGVDDFVLEMRSESFWERLFPWTRSILGIGSSRTTQ